MFLFLAAHGLGPVEKQNLSWVTWVNSGSKSFWLGVWGHCPTQIALTPMKSLLGVIFAPGPCSQPKRRRGLTPSESSGFLARIALVTLTFSQDGLPGHASLPVDMKRDPSISLQCSRLRRLTYRSQLGRKYLLQKLWGDSTGIHLPDQVFTGTYIKTQLYNSGQPCLSKVAASRP